MTKAKEPPVEESELRSGMSALFRALGDAVNEISERLDEGQTEGVAQSFDFETAKGPMRAETGIRVRMLGIDEPLDRPDKDYFRQSKEKQKDSKERKRAQNYEFVYDIIADADSWCLTADIPGATRADLILSEIAGELEIRATGTRDYRTKVPIPDGASIDQISNSLQNGILELRFSRKGESG